MCRCLDTLVDCRRPTNSIFGAHNRNGWRYIVQYLWRVLSILQGSYHMRHVNRNYDGRRYLRQSQLFFTLPVHIGRLTIAHSNSLSHRLQVAFRPPPCLRLRRQCIDVLLSCSHCRRASSPAIVSCIYSLQLGLCQTVLTNIDKDKAVLVRLAAGHGRKILSTPPTSSLRSS